VAVTVGFLAGVALPATDGSQTPASGSTGNEYTFAVTNSGNGTDSVNVAFTPSANVTITGYRIDGGAILTAGQLGSGLSQRVLAMGEAVNVTVIYSIAAIVGGGAESIDITANSRRTPGTTDTHQLDIVPASVAVTPDGSAVSNLPGTYTAAYTITNNSSLTLTYELTAASSTGAATVGAITHAAGGTFTAGATPTLQLTAGQSGTVNLSYTIPTSAAAGATSNLTLTAASNAAPVVSDAGTWALTVNRPVIAMSKQAWNADRSAQIAAAVQPGQTIWYRIQVENTGNFAASTITVTDALPAEVTYVSAEPDVNDSAWTITGTSTVEGVLSTLAAAGTRFFWIQVTVN
jgi:uncharacterized repeat protein (TIGR01451 family)